MAEKKVRCPYCPQEVVVSQLHRHCSAFHWGKDPSKPGKEIERKRSPREVGDPHQLTIEDFLSAIPPQQL